MQMFMALGDQARVERARRRDMLSRLDVQS
jgi:hypothetical protein